MGRKGRPSKYYPYEQAKELIQAECITSIATYHKWFADNRPKKIPKRPDVIYLGKGWVTWNIFLGNKNPFSHGKKDYIPYDDAKRHSRSLGFNSAQQWKQYCREGKCPPNIPHRPDYYYKTWFTWRDWLGKDLKQIVRETIRIVPVLYVIKTRDMTASNVYKINVTNGGRKALLDAIEQGARVLAAFEYTQNIDWRSILRKYGNNHSYGAPDDYVMTNMNAFMFEISSVLNTFKL